jgi:hypothetical protein
MDEPSAAPQSHEIDRGLTEPHGEEDDEQR